MDYNALAAELGKWYENLFTVRDNMEEDGIPDMDPKLRQELVEKLQFVINEARELKRCLTGEGQ